MALSRTTKHFQEGLQALIPPFWGKPRIAALLRSYLRQVQLLEDRTWEVLDAFHVNTADAARLAVLGRVVGQPNYGWDLETYRAVIRAKIATNRSHGRDDDVVNVLRLITGGTGPIVLTHLVPATLLIDVQEPIAATHLPAIRFLLPKARAAGVGMRMTAAVGEGFTLDSAVAPAAGAGALDSTVTPISGAGELGTVISFP